MKIFLRNLPYNIDNHKRKIFVRALTFGCTGRKNEELTNAVKKDIEKHWEPQINHGTFNSNDGSNKFYVLSMFPYPSGKLHMGHVRVYTISDTMARYYRMNGKNVFHPIGWDAFGLPAENAAIQRKIEPSEWTKFNISQMKEQLTSLGYSFDWPHELSTCDPEYFRWTQMLFLKLFQEGLVYQKEALVNWDPVDKTVLADEQVDINGNSWRSGAKVEKKLLKQWFIRTTKFAKNLLDGLDDPTLQDWKDITNLQRHWIGECNGYAFDLKIVSGQENFNNNSRSIRIWTQNPERFTDPGAFVIVKSNNHIKALQTNTIPLEVFNPFMNKKMPIVFYDDYEYPDKSDVYLVSPNTNDNDKELAKCLNISFENMTNLSQLSDENKQNVLNLAQELNIGGYPVSSKLQDWLISRQRYWGTPIPIIHCSKCGTVPMGDENLPYISNRNGNKKIACPKCNNENAEPETDTMDTFVDSSWYFLRFLDSKNQERMFDENIIKKFMPVDLYIGGKEHAVLHLYYARFMNHFLHSLNMVPEPEPFKRLLVQGMVMGRSYRLKGTGEYINENEIKIVDKKKNKAIQITTEKEVVIAWEKMSKSKLNGVDPSDIVSEYGCDTTRLIILGDVAPTSHRNWSSATFPGILNWQRRLWLTINDFCELRNNLPPPPEEYDKLQAEEEKMFDARNYYVRGATFNYKYSHQLSVAISKMQGLTNSIRRCPKNLIPHLKQYERALSCQIIMLAPMAPHFASELWSKFAMAPNRLNTDSSEIDWNKDALGQRWPNVDMEYNLDLSFRINGFDTAILKIPRYQLDVLKCEEAIDISFNNDSVKTYLTGKKIKNIRYEHYPGCEAILHFTTDKIEKKSSGQIEEKIIQ